MDENRAILEALSELECILYYAGSGNDLQPEINEIHDEAKAMLERWHFLTGITL